MIGECATVQLGRQPSMAYRKDIVPNPQSHMHADQIAIAGS